MIMKEKSSSNLHAKLMHLKSNHCVYNATCIIEYYYIYYTYILELSILWIGNATSRAEWNTYCN